MELEETRACDPFDKGGSVRHSDARGQGGYLVAQAFRRAIPHFLTPATIYCDDRAALRLAIDDNYHAQPKRKMSENPKRKGKINLNALGQSPARREPHLYVHLITVMGACMPTREWPWWVLGPRHRDGRHHDLSCSVGLCITAPSQYPGGLARK